MSWQQYLKSDETVMWWNDKFNSQRICRDTGTPDADDIRAYRKVLDDLYRNFINARTEHGNHLDNPSWYDFNELECKCWRYIKAKELGIELTGEELEDLANYAIMALSRKHITGGE